ncbi:hypothetical protein diail_7138, partial [Diaporthe ilicicola]
FLRRLTMPVAGATVPTKSKLHVMPSWQARASSGSFCGVGVGVEDGERFLAATGAVGVVVVGGVGGVGGALPSLKWMFSMAGSLEPIGFRFSV